MISLTTDFFITNTKGIRQQVRFVPEITQYRSRTMSNNAIIIAALSYLSALGKMVSVHTKAIPIDENEADIVVNAELDDKNNYSDVYIKLFCTARNAEYTEKLKEKIKVNHPLELTPKITTPGLKAKLYVNQETDDMCIITNMMTDQLWFAIGAYYTDTEELKEVWSTGDGTKITAYFQSRKIKELKETEKAEIESFLNEYKAGVQRDDPRLKELEELKTIYGNLLVSLDTKAAEIRTLERDIIYNAYTDSEEQVTLLKTAVEKMYKKGTLKNIKTRNNVIELTIDTDLIYFDTEAFKTIRTSSRPNWYTTLSESNKKLIDAILYTKELKLAMTNEIRIYKSNATLDTVRGSIADVGYKNPHHYHYNCWGDYATKIREAIRDYKWEELLIYLTAATAGINVLDIAVMNKFISDLTIDYYNKPILKRGYALISPKDYIKEVLING